MQILVRHEHEWRPLTGAFWTVSGGEGADSLGPPQRPSPQLGAPVDGSSQSRAA